MRVVVVGGGVLGLSAAWHLASLGAKTVVLEQAPAPAQGSTAGATGGFRTQFATAPNVRLSLLSLDFFRAVAAEIGFQQSGYLLLARTPEEMGALEAAVAVQRAEGVPSRTIGPSEAAALFPGLRTFDLEGASYSPTDGTFEPPLIARALLHRAEAAGAAVRLACEVTAIETGRVHTAGGVERADAVVIAAGPWSGRFGLPVQPLRRQLLSLPPLPGVPERMPLTIEIATTWVARREADGGLRLGEDMPGVPFGFTDGVDEAWNEQVLARTAHRLPLTAGARPRRTWHCHYEVTPDGNPIIGPVADGIFAVTGFSGHSVMHAPAAGRLLAELVVRGRVEFDLSPYSLSRFAGGGRREGIFLV